MSSRSVAAIVLVAAGRSVAAAQDKPSNQIPCAAIDSIGTAEMANDGTITMQLRSLWPDPIAEASSFMRLTIRNMTRSSSISATSHPGASQAGHSRGAGSIPNRDAGAAETSGGAGCVRIAADRFARGRRSQ